MKPPCDFKNTNLYSGYLQKTGFEQFFATFSLSNVFSTLRENPEKLFSMIFAFMVSCTKDTVIKQPI